MAQALPQASHDPAVPDTAAEAANIDLSHGC
jgi:hypothetical protein